MLIEKTRTWAEIHLDRLTANIKKIQAAANGCEIMAVVKANAYGHGDCAVACCLEKCGIHRFAVSNIDEALSIRKICPDSEILILGYTHPSHADILSDSNIIQGIISSEYAEELSQYAVKCGKTVRAHIKLDTGMGRVGLRCSSVGEYADECVKTAMLEGIAAEGIYTHFSVADSDSKDDIEFTAMQRDCIRNVYRAANKVLPDERKIRYIHYLNSAAMCYGADADGSDIRSSFVRAGIIMYGLMPNSALALPLKLEPVMEFKSVISHIKTVEAGTPISYGRTFIAPHRMEIATLPVGYADGYPRLLSSKGEIIINGKRCAITGRICMDQLMCDVTGANAHVGDIATLFGIDGNEMITADELADAYGSIGYELICGISKRVPRIIIE